MDLHLLGTIRTGPIRWNLSNSGIGVSAGTHSIPNPRQRLGSSTSNQDTARQSTAAPRAQSSTIPDSPPFANWPPSSATPYNFVPATDISNYAPASADALAQYIASQRRHASVFVMAAVILTLVNVVILATFWQLLILVLPLSIYGGLYFRQLDRRRTHVALNYELDELESRNFQQLVAGMESLASTARLLRVDARQVHSAGRARLAA